MSLLNKILGIEKKKSTFDNSLEWIEEGKRLYKEGKNGWGESLDKKNNDPMRMVIEPISLNTNKIDDICLPQIKSFEFRPQKWEQFIGQENAKAQVDVIIKMFKYGIRTHIALTGLSGHGKTSYAELLAKTLDAHFIQRIGHSVSMDSLVDIINEINQTEKSCVLFFDEVETTDKEIIKQMNSVIESYQINGKRIKPFLFICASINMDVLQDRNPDFLSRIKHKISFVRYTIEELTAIASQVHQQLYSDKTITKEQLNLLALNCKFNPRNIVNLLEYLVINNDINYVFKICDIIKDGLTGTDVKILKFLNSCNKPIGANAIAMKFGMKQRMYEIEHEPYLFEMGYLSRLPSRAITQKGKEFLQSIKEN